MKYTALPGFRDFYPEEMALRNQIFGAWREIARRYGFDEYDGPPLETLDLYVEKSGPEIVGQLFNFTDKGGREVALRPEMTPSVVRMLGSRIKEMPTPIRWFSTPQLFRYEKQQRGRLREHFQLNMDIFGEKSVLADADLLAAALDVLRFLGLGPDDVVARVSDRRLLQNALSELGVDESQLPLAYGVIDKVEREERSTLLERLKEAGLERDAAEAALDLTSLGRDDLRSRYGSSEAMSVILDEIDVYFDALESLGFRDWVTFDMKIVRGLAYYTGIVFEIFDRKGELRAICGGGRYDRLFTTLTGIDLPALGFGFGDVVLGELLKERGLAATERPAPDVVVLAVVDETRRLALEVASRLRAAGVSVIFPYRTGGVGKALKRAANAGVREAILIGPDEVGAGVVLVRSLQESSERKISVDEYLGGRRDRS
jgi:histidyl-tRNA synthetase